MRRSSVFNAVLVALFVAVSGWSVVSNISYLDHMFQGDLLIQTDNNQDIGEDGSKAANIYAHNVDTQSLQVDSNATVGGGLFLTGSSSPAQTSSTDTGLLWFTSGTPDAGAVAGKIYLWDGADWLLLDDGSDLY